MCTSLALVITVSFCLGGLTLAPPGVVQAQQQQAIFSPTSTGIQSPVQILGKYCKDHHSQPVLHRYL